MCKILNTNPDPLARGSRSLTNELTSGLPTSLSRGTILNNITLCQMEVSCLHPDGRSDDYVLEPGDALEIDESAKMTVTNAEDIGPLIEWVEDRINEGYDIQPNWNLDPSPIRYNE